MTNPFVLFSLFFPRTTLFVYYFFLGMPINDTPLILDVVAAIFAPRLLIAWWLYIAGWHPLWIVLFVLFTLGEGGGGSTTASRRRKS